MLVVFCRWSLDEGKMSYIDDVDDAVGGSSAAGGSGRGLDGGSLGGADGVGGADIGVGVGGGVVRGGDGPQDSTHDLSTRRVLAHVEAWRQMKKR